MAPNPVGIFGPSLARSLPATAEDIQQVNLIHTHIPRRFTRIGGQTPTAAAVARGEQSDPNSYWEVMLNENAVPWKVAMRE